MKREFDPASDEREFAPQTTSRYLPVDLQIAFADSKGRIDHILHLSNCD